MEKKQLDMMSNREKMVTSVAVWIGTFTMGLCNGVLGPSLMQFSVKFDTEVATVSKVFPFQTGSWLIGALGSGFVFNYVNRQLASVWILFILGLCNIALPFAPNLLTFFATAILSGIAWSAYDTSQTVWMIELWEGDAAAYIQTQHFSYALGAFVSPMVVKYCLPEEANDLENTPGIPSTLEHGVIAGSAPGTLSPLLWIPFTVAGAVSILSGIFIFLLYKIKKYDKSRVLSNRKLAGEAPKRFEGNLLVTTILVALATLFLGPYVGMEQISFQFLPAYTYFSHLQMTQRQGASVLSALAAAFTAGRAIGIVVVLKLIPEILLSLNLIIIVAGNCLLLFSNSWIVTYSAAILLGLGFSTIYAAFFGFIEKHMEISNIVGGVLIAIMSIIASMFPLFVGFFIEKDPSILIYTTFFCLGVGIAVFLIMYAIVRPQNSENPKRAGCSIKICRNTEFYEIH